MADYNGVRDLASIERRLEPTPLDELIRRGHEAHMRSIKQDEWLKNLFRKADKMKAQQDRKLAADMEKSFPTGTRKKSSA